MTELVSVVIPTFNRKQLLYEAIESVFSQTYRHVEIIVIDDGSTDGTKEVVEGLIKNPFKPSDKTLKYFYKKNGGAPSARNVGLSKASGEYIQYLDSDDLLDHRKIEFHVAALQQLDNADIVIGASFDFETGLRTAPFDDDSLRSLQLKSIHSWTLPVLNPMFTKRAISVLGDWDEDMKTFEDAPYMAKIYSNGLRVVKDFRAVSLIRGHHSSSRSWEGAPRVSYRGEVDRVHENITATAKHLKTILEIYPYIGKTDPELEAQIQKSYMHVKRNLHASSIGTKMFGLCRPTRIYGSKQRVSFLIRGLDFLSKMLGDRLGATLHKIIHEAAYEIKHRLLLR